MLGNLTGWHLLIILAVLLLLFGAAKLPALSKGIGQSIRIFKNEVAPAVTGRPSSTETPAGNTDDIVNSAVTADADRP
jgi:sec-independent protein translocase protein TatA